MATAVFLANNLQGARDAEALGFDAIENFNVTKTAKTSNHPVEDGSNITDHYFEDPLIASFTGVVTPWNFTGKGTDLSPNDFVREVNNTIVGKVPFSLYLSDDLQSIPSCVFTKFEYRRKASEGKSIIVDVSVQQIQRVPSAERVELESQSLAPDVSEQGQNGVNKGDELSNTYPLSLVVSGLKLGDASDEFIQLLGAVPE